MAWTPVTFLLRIPVLEALKNSKMVSDDKHAPRRVSLLESSVRETHRFYRYTCRRNSLCHVNSTLWQRVAFGNLGFQLLSFKSCVIRAADCIYFKMLISVSHKRKYILNVILIYH